MELIKGQWYKYNSPSGIWYIKFKRVDSGKYFEASEYIDNRKKYTNSWGCFGNIVDTNKSLLENLDEIKPFLPFDHPDLNQDPHYEIY